MHSMAHFVQNRHIWWFEPSYMMVFIPYHLWWLWWFMKTIIYDGFWSMSHHFWWRGAKHPSTLKSWWNIYLKSTIEKSNSSIITKNYVFPFFRELGVLSLNINLYISYAYDLFCWLFLFSFLSLMHNVMTYIHTHRRNWKRKTIINVLKYGRPI